MRAVFPNPDGSLAPGFFARVRIPGSGEFDAVLIRESAIGTDQGHPFVYVVGEGDVVAYRPIELGPSTEGLRSVRRGLAANERVIVNGLMNVRPGAKVAATEASMRAAPGGTNAVAAAVAVANAAAPPASSAAASTTPPPASAPPTGRP